MFLPNPRFREILWLKNDEESQCAWLSSEDGRRWVLTVTTEGRYQIHRVTNKKLIYYGQGYVGILLRPGDTGSYLEKARLRVYGQWRKLASKTRQTKTDDVS